MKFNKIQFQKLLGLILKKLFNIVENQYQEQIYRNMKISEENTILNSTMVKLVIKIKLSLIGLVKINSKIKICLIKITKKKMKMTSIVN